MQAPSRPLDGDHERQHLLIVVHPGSCCGSTDQEHGRSLGDALRESIAKELDEWSGALLVIDGFLSDELEKGVGRASWNALGRAIKGAIRRNLGHGHIAERIWGCDNSDENQEVAISSFIKQHTLDPASWNIVLTGAWFDPDNKTGCVNSVGNQLAQAGFSYTVSDTAIEIAPEEE